MTWYREGKEIGGMLDVANWMLDAVIGQSNEEASDWEDDFEAYLNEEFEPMEILRLCERQGCGYNELFMGWVIGMARYDDAFESDYGFEWRDDE